MAKPSIIASFVVIILCVGLIAIEAAGLGIFLSNYDQLDVDFVTAGKLVGAFAPFAAVPILLLAITTVCIVSPIDPSPLGRVCVGLFWAITTFVSIVCSILSALAFVVNSLIGIDCDYYTGTNGSPLAIPQCDDITNIGKYLSIASCVMFAVIFILSIFLSCLNCCCQQVDEGKREDAVTFVGMGIV